MTRHIPMTALDEHVEGPAEPNGNGEKGATEK